MIGERTKAALDHKASKGEWCGRIPFGFTVGKGRKLVEDSDEMQAIASVKRARRRGRSVRQLAIEHGVSKSTVHKVTSTDLRVLRKSVGLERSSPH